MVGLRAAAAGGHRRPARSGVQLAQHPGAPVRAGVDGRRAVARRPARAACPSSGWAGRSTIGGVHVALPGVRLTLWLAALIIIVRRRAGPALGPGRPALQGAIGRAPTRRSDGCRCAGTRRGPRPARDPRPVHRLRGRRGVRQVDPGPACWPPRLDAVLTREPGGTDGGRELRALLLDPATVGLDARAEALLMAADRAQHVAEVVDAGAGRRAPRGHRPLRRLVDRLPGLRPGARPSTRCAGCPSGRPTGCGPTWSCCSTSPRRGGRRPGSAPTSIASSRSGAAFHGRVRRRVPGPGRRRSRPLGGGRRRRRASTRWPSAVRAAVAGAATTRRCEPRRLDRARADARRRRPVGDGGRPGPGRRPAAARRPRLRCTPTCWSDRGAAASGRWPRPSPPRCCRPSPTGADAERHRRLALAETHPDLVVTERTGPSITAEQARDIVDRASRAPGRGARKVLVLDEFHLVLRNAPDPVEDDRGAAAPGTVFVVLAEEVPPELVTIASRCVRIDLGPVPDRRHRRAAGGRGHRPPTRRPRRRPPRRPATWVGPGCWPPTRAWRCAATRGPRVPDRARRHRRDRGRGWSTSCSP